jgi:poly(3-hydroxyalkanoate) synthetase
MELTRRILNNTARVPGDGDLQVLEDAPGSYVKVRTLSE